MLLYKVAGVIPDIHRLLDQYRETHGQLSAKDLLAKQAEAMHVEQVNKIQLELQVTRTEYEKAIRTVVDENAQLKKDVQELRSQLASSEKLTQENLCLKTQLTGIEDKHTKDLMEKDAQHNQALSNQQQAMADKDVEHSRTLNDHKTILSKVQLELANLITKHSNQKKDLEASRATEVELRKKLEGQEIRHVQQFGNLESSSTKSMPGAFSDSEEHYLRVVETLNAEILMLRQQSEKTRAEHEVYRRQQEERAAKQKLLADGVGKWKTKHEEMRREHENLERLLREIGHG